MSNELCSLCDLEKTVVADIVITIRPSGKTTKICACWECCESITRDAKRIKLLTKETK